MARRGIRTRALAALLVLLGLVGLAGCGSSRETRIPGHTLTVYSSLPLNGVSAPLARAAAAGESLALADAGGSAGHRRVRLIRLDSTRPDGRIWEPALVSANAKRAANDPTTVAYLGELDYGASAVSVPITNDKDIFQLSPGDGLASLTAAPPGHPEEGPARYYPKDDRSFLRLAPSDRQLAQTLLALARGAGAHRAAIVFDPHIYARELATELAAFGRSNGPKPVSGEALHGDPSGVPGLVRSLADDHPDAILYAGVAGPLTEPLFAALARVLPRVPVFASPGILAERSRLEPPPPRVQAISTVKPASELSPRARRLLGRIAARAGLRSVDPEALYGYEAMRLVIDAVDRAGPNRPGVVREGLRPRVRRSALGSYGVRRTGDVDMHGLFLYRLVDGRFRFERELP